MGNKRQTHKIKMNCPNCSQELKEIKVDIEDAKTPAISYQCPNPNCDYFTFEPITTMKVIKELKEKESPLKIKQKIIKLSQDRLGMYFSQDIIKSLDLKSGEEILVSVPDKKRIVLDL